MIMLPNSTFLTLLVFERCHFFVPGEILEAEKMKGKIGMSNQRQIEALNELLKGEYMARDIYDKTKGIQGDHQVKDLLAKFQEDHDRHIERLKQRILELGGEPIEGTGFAGTMANLSATYKAMLGPEAILKQVYEGEKMGVHSYEDRLDGLDETSQELVKEIMAEDHEHLKFFEARMDHEQQEDSFEQ